MGLNQTKNYAQPKNQQNEKTIYGKKENICEPYMRSGVDNKIYWFNLIAK